jgi:8-oxo-dGTP diphosphatase
VDETEFLRSYDPTVFERPSVAVDLVLMSIIDEAPAALLIRRSEHPCLGCWALPGGFVGINESVDEAAMRVLREKARMEGAYVEQLYTFGAVDRDPRTRVISVAHFALLPAERFSAALRMDPALTVARIVVPSAGGSGGSATACAADGQSLPLAFDHAEILGLAIHRLRGKLAYSDIAFALLPELFTLRQLQAIHEAILGARLNKPAFRRRMLDSGRLEPTGERETGASFRPAELYRHRTGLQQGKE